MSNIVKHTEFKKVVNALWNKVKENFVTEVKYDSTSKKLKYTKNGTDTDITNVVTKWGDLERVEEYPYVNLFNINSIQQGKQYGINGQVINSTSNWYISECKVEENTEYTLLKKHKYNNAYKIVFFNGDGSFHSEDNNDAPASNDWHRKTVTIPQGVTKVGLQLQYGTSQLPSAHKMMFLKGRVTENIDPFIPFADGQSIQVGSEISLKFDNSNSNLKSTTVNSAIKEIDSKFSTTVKSVNEQLPDDLGNVTINASQINTLNGNSVENELSELSIRKADKYKPTIMTDLTVDDIKLTDRPIKQTISIAGDGLAGTKTLAGNMNTSIPRDTKISFVKVGLWGYSEGETVTGIEVYAVDKASNTIVERIVYDGTGVARIQKGLEQYGVLYVDIEVNKSFNVEVYFIARLKVNNGKGLRLYGTLTTGIAFDKRTDDEYLAPGTQITDRSSRVPNMIIYGDGVSLSNAFVDATLNNANGIDFTRANGTTKTITIPTTGAGGTVTSVNGVDPNPQGNVTVDAEHINAQGGVTVQQALNNKVNTSQIGNTAGKIPQIGNDGVLHTSIMPALAITEVFVVANEQEMMTKTVQVGDVVVVENEDNTAYMCKNEQASAKLDKFVPINTGLSVVKQVNTKKPDPTGTVTLDGTHINATVGGHKDTIQSHLETANNNIVAANNNIGNINSVVGSLSRDVSNVTSDLGNVKTTINNHNTRISNLESKKHGVKVGEVISTLNTTLGETYVADGVTFLYIGRDKLVTRNDYPQLPGALGIPSGVNNFNIPVIADITFRYDHSSRTATRRHYMVVKM